MMTDNIAPLLALAFTEIVGQPEPGSMAYTRCLPPEVVRTLAADARFTVSGWQIAAVVEAENLNHRCITADKAVEWREDKQGATLLLVDPASAGAGMDGIYSAAKEIGETELFATAQELARQRLPQDYKGFVQKALTKARQTARQRNLAPWCAFDYLCRAVQRTDTAGGALPQIGLWPVAIGDKPDKEDLDRAARLVERLFPMQGVRLTPEARVAALKLGAGEEETERRLIRFLRETERLPRLEALALLESEPDFWLNRLRPGLFDEQTLQSITWVPWRGKTRKPAAWSGLIANDDDRLELRLNPNPDSPKELARLEVRWKVEPDTLAKGAVDYLVEIRADQDVLAEKNIDHSGKSPQKVVFTQDDLEELDENARFEAQVVIRALGERLCEAESEDFILRFGESDKQTGSSAGRLYPTMALAIAHIVPDGDGFRRLAKEPGNKQFFGRDAKGYITCRWERRAGKVFCPPLLTRLADDWVARNGALGRWRLPVRADGRPVGEAEFIPVDADPAAERLREASRQLADWLAGSQGPLGILYDNLEVINRYVRSALDIWLNSAPALTLIQTLEVISLAGRRLGLIVLPTHPLRVAWQQSFDLLVAHYRYEEGLPAVKLQRLLANVTSAHCPAFMPGIEPGESFIFADTLGFHAAALVPADDPEPKATVALLARLLGDDETAAPTVGKGAAKALAGEVQRYLQLHPDYRRIQVHALRAGDAMPVVRALGHALQIPADEDEETPEDGANHLCYELNLYPAAGQATELTGRFLAVTAERRRSGAGVVPAEDRWLLESVARPGGVSLPRLRWARRATAKPDTHAHLAFAFDMFTSRVVCKSLTDLPAGGVLEAHGLALMPTRQFHPGPTPYWLSFIPPEPAGEKHPASRALTDRQVKLHAAILSATARHLGGGTGDLPVLLTEVGPEQADLLQDLHGLCDWVITADRNAGIEYFDSPRDLPQVYDAYIIDCVPERDDLGFLQLITSTSSFDEVVNLMDAALGEMGLSASPRNCRFLLDALKAVSGRLALRLAGAGSAAQEMIAVALVHSHCAQAGEAEDVWLPLQEGFLVPLDDVPELFRESDDTPPGSEQRADLLYVNVPKRGGLRLTFVEVKFRRYLKTARAPELAQAMERQLGASCQRWEQLFGVKTSALEQTVNRAWLARILRFYARKGRRHTLSEEALQRIMREIDRIVRKEAELPALMDLNRVGYVFCPEYGGRKPVLIGHSRDISLWLFGPGILPEPRRDGTATELSTPLTADIPAEAIPVTNNVDSETVEVTSEETPLEAPVTVEAEVLLGHRDTGDEPVIWRPSIKANPHLMILGLPGMGKTTCLINLCRQLVAQCITPIIFSYHQDIDEKLTAYLPNPPLFVRYAGLGFNPMQVDDESPLAYLDTVGMLRDIFAAIFPDLGDVQLGRLRETLKQSYLDQGWAPGQRGTAPAFRTFFDLLRTEAKPDKGLLTRLNELDDYGVFDAGTGMPTVLDTTRPTLIQIHGTQNDYLQRAFATFVLYNLYQNMFRRGPQERITHAVIFDEAHRAARLKLIPTMVKECRKYGIAFVLASQEAKDFDPSLFTAVANYLALRLNETDAKLMAKIFAASDKIGLYTDRIKQMPKYRGMYYGEGLRLPISVALAPEVPV